MINGMLNSAATIRLISSPPATPEAFVITSEIAHCCQSAFSNSAVIGGRKAMIRSRLNPEAIAVSRDVTAGKIRGKKFGFSSQFSNKRYN